MGLLKAINITFMLFINNRNRNDCSILKVNLFRIYQRVAENSFLFFSARSNIVQLIRSLEKKKKRRESRATVLNAIYEQANFHSE